jgi:hydroxymethylbilane synthase
MKDVPAVLPDGLRLSVFPPREDPRDALVSAHDTPLEELPPGGAVGTGSLRRAAQLLALRPDLRVVPLRGNVDTRLKKLKTEGLQAVVLAAAGLRRLGLAHRISQALPVSRVLPAVGQGALGLESREGDPVVEEALAFLDHEETVLTVRTERAFLKRLGGGCQVPIAGHARLVKGVLVLQGLVAELDGGKIIRDEVSGSRHDTEGIGVRLAESLLAAGADRILARIYGDAWPGAPSPRP